VSLRAGLTLTRCARTRSLASGHGMATARNGIYASAKHWRAIRQQYDALERQREQLPELEERIRSAEAASQEAADIEAAIALVEARRQRAKADALLSRFPDAMARLNGDEIRRLQSLEDQLTSLRNEHAVSEQALARASQAMVDTGLADNAPSEGPSIEACRGKPGAGRAMRRQAHGTGGCAGPGACPGTAGCSESAPQTRL